MKIARVLFPVKTLGPGNRMAVWMYGCSRGCGGCANPELWDGREAKEVKLDVLQHAVEQIRNNPDLPPIDGFTISGGEPFDQPEALQEMLDYFLTISEDILVFTGYKIEELAQHRVWMTEKIGVLIDGPYIEEQNNGHPLKGSNNQIIHYVNQKLQNTYLVYINNKRKENGVEIFPVHDGSIAVGIHHKDFQTEFENRMEEKGLQVQR